MIYVILLLALIFRLILANQSFWLDEAATLELAKLPLLQMLASMGGEFHPPLFHVIMHFWLKIGYISEWFLRLPSITFGVLTVYLTYLLLKQLKLSQSIALTAAFLLAINPFHIYYSQELRMYSLNAFLTVLSWYFLIKLTRYPKKNHLWFLLGFVNLANAYSFYGSFFSLLAQTIFLVGTHRLPAGKHGRLLLKFAILHLAFLLAFLPWLPKFLIQLRGGLWLQSILPGWKALSGSLTLKSLFLIPAKFALGRINFSTDKLFLLAAFSVTFYFLSFILLSWRQRQAKLLWYWLIIPLITACLISFSTPILGYWRYLFLLPPFISLLSIGLNSFPPTFTYLNLFVISLTFLLSNLLFWSTLIFQREDWRSAVNFVRAKPDSVSIFAFSDVFAPVRWYGGNTLAYSAPLKDLTVKPDTLDLKLSQATLNKKKVYYFEYLAALTDPHKNIQTWLTNAGFIQTAIHNFPGVGFVYEYQPVR